MSVRGELFTTQVVLDNRSYFFNVKENRTGDVFLQVVESKNKDGSNFDRHAIVVFEEDMQKFFKGLEESLSFIEKDKKEKKKKAQEKKAAKQAYSDKIKQGSSGTGAKKPLVKKVQSKRSAKPSDRNADERKPDGIKRSGKVIVVKKS